MSVLVPFKLTSVGLFQVLRNTGHKMTVPARKNVKLFYDVVSPYSWVAFEVLTRYKSVWDSMELNLKPVFLGGLITEASNKSPALVHNKGIYNFKQDLPRLARYHRIPIKVPKNPSMVMFEKTSLSAMRFVTAINHIHPQYTEDLSRELWMRAWSRDEGIFDRADFVEAGDRVGIDKSITQSAIEMMGSDFIKSQLRAVTTEALNYGAFGVPTIVTFNNGQSEIVFGSDRFHILAMILNEEWQGPLNNLSKFEYTPE